MLNIIKVFGLGILYTLLLPFIIAFWLLYAVYCVIAFLLMAIKNIIVFFAGGTPLGDLKEDVEAKRILMQQKEAEANTNQAMMNAYTQAMTSVISAVQTAAAAQAMQQNSVNNQATPTMPQFNNAGPQDDQIDIYPNEASNEDEEND